MKQWAGENLGLCSAESYHRFHDINKNPQELNNDIVLRNALLDFIADFANWENSSVRQYLDTGRAITQAAHGSLGSVGQTRPFIVDPFAGGGSIPLESLRLGADTFASDLNPVAVLLNKVLLEYIPAFGGRLAPEVRKWGEWIRTEAERELGEFYPNDPDGAIPIAYLWARTVLSEAPGTAALPIEVPLFRSMWLAKKKGRNRALRWKRDSTGNIETEIAEVEYSNGNRLRVRRPLVEIFEPKSPTDVERGPSRGGAATCPITGFTTSVENVRRQLAERAGGTSDARLMCVVTVRKDTAGRNYRLPQAGDVRVLQRVADLATTRLPKITDGLSTVPNEKLNHPRGFFNVVLYGITTWGDVFRLDKN